jgi:hypothetical protein
MPEPWGVKSLAMKITSCIILLFSVLTPGLLAQAPAPAATCTLQGHITDALGAAITRGFFLVHSEERPELDQQVPWNESGDFRIQLAPGLYDLFVGSVGFMPYAKEIRVEAGKPVALKIKLQVNLMIITED